MAQVEGSSVDVYLSLPSDIPRLYEPPCPEFADDFYVPPIDLTELEHPYVHTTRFKENNAAY